MDLRRRISSLLRRFNSFYKLKNTERINLRNIDEYIDFISFSHRKPNSLVESYYSEQMLLINLHLISFGSLALAARMSSEESESKNIILNKSFSGRDIHLCGFLNNICNTASASINLIKQGYDTQARILVRTLDERIYQCMVLFSSDEDYQAWSKAEAQEEAKGAHYNLFARKGRLLKRVAELEEQYLDLKDRGDEIRSWRKEREEYYSMAVHGSSAAVLVGSASFSLGDEDKVYMPNLFGIPSSASKGTISHIIYQLHILALMLPSILKDVHGWEPDMSKENERMYQVVNDIVTFLSGQWIIKSHLRDEEAVQ